MLSDDNRGTFIVQKNVLFCERFFVLRRQAPDGRIVSVFCGSGFCGDLLLFFFLREISEKDCSDNGCPCNKFEKSLSQFSFNFLFCQRIVSFLQYFGGRILSKLLRNWNASVSKVKNVSFFYWNFVCFLTNRQKCAILCADKDEIPDPEGTSIHGKDHSYCRR